MRTRLRNTETGSAHGRHSGTRSGGRRGADAELVVPSGIVKDAPILADLGGQTAIICMAQQLINKLVVTINPDSRFAIFSSAFCLLGATRCP